MIKAVSKSLNFKYNVFNPPNGEKWGEDKVGKSHEIR